MQRVNALKSDDGQLHTDPKRCAAANMVSRLPAQFRDSNGKVLEFSQCLAIIENRAVIEQCLRELDSVDVVGLPVND